jgi:putative chitinase
MLTAEIINRLAPKARKTYVDALLNGQETFDKYGITTPMRMAQFLATILHESGGLTIVEENLNYTATRIKQVWPTRPEAVKFAKNPRALANSVYGSRMGNQDNGTNDDDGYRYRGRGLIQLTGKDSYKRAGDAIGVDLVANPDLLADGVISLKAACWEFSKFVSYCDRGTNGFRAVCNGINRGNASSSLDPIGWVDRQYQLKKCTDALGAAVAPDDTLEVGDHGALVKAFQERLTALGYPVGKIDGVFGSRTRAAVLAFQAEQGLVTDGKIGPKTRAALNADDATPMPLGDRAFETKDDIKAAGDVTLQTTDAVKAAAKTAGTVATTFMAADQTGLLDWGSSLVSDMNQYRGVASGLTDVIAWSVGHWYYFVPLVAYLGYRWAKSVEGQRVLAHRLGFDLSK